jgi:uncharacterized protein (TIGR03032 family)
LQRRYASGIRGAAMTASPDTQPFTLTTSPGFPSWLASIPGSLAFTTYQAGKLFLLGVRPDGSLSVFERSFPRCMGIGVSADGRSLALATQIQIQRFDNVLAQDGASPPRDYDAVYAPHAAWVTGDLDVHDVGWGADGRPVFVNTLFGCIAEVSDDHSFRPIWMPPFLSRLAAEDRCHLNGMAMADGRPLYATAVARSDVAQGWRDQRREGGVVIDVGSGEIVAAGLSMPHSPRLHDGQLWLLNSGSGELGRIDRAKGGFEPVTLCPGYARGLTLVGGHAVVGLSLARENSNFQGLDLDRNLADRNIEPQCGLAVIDTGSGEIIAWARIEGVVRELYDVAFIPGVRCPSAIGFRTDEVKHLISIAG